MSPSIQKFVSIAGHTEWAPAHSAGLDPTADSARMLARVPGTSGVSVVDLPGPYAPLLDGFSVSPCGEVVFVVPAKQSLVAVDPHCLDRRVVLSAGSCPGDVTFESMSGSAAGRDRLYVADENGKRILALRLPGLEFLSSWEHVCDGPRRLAVDGLGRIYALDVKLLKLVRLDSSGQTDPSYGTVQVAGFVDALDLFVSADGAAFVSVSGAAPILRFSPTGTRVDPLWPPDEAQSFHPGALAGDAHRLYVADRTSGRLWVYDLSAGLWSSLPHFRAPVAGLATDGDGHLYVRTGADTTYLRLDASTAHVSRGFLDAGPFDAGEQCAWMRVHVDADVPEGTRVRIKTGLAAKSDAAPVWKPAPSLDSLVHPPAPAGMSPDPAARFLWIRVDLETDDPSRSPRLRQIVAETPGEDYLAKLPAVYARKDAEAGGFLRTFLEAFRAELGDRELEIDSLAKRLDPATAPTDHLEWLASWAAFDVPPDADTAKRRALLLDAHRLYGRRGTIQGLREMVRIYAGVECEIVESFRARRLWALGGARLGFETGLLGALPDGMVVPGPSLPEPSLQGLRAEYFLDDRLGTSAATPDRGGDRCEPRSSEPPLIEPNGHFPFFKVPGSPADRTLKAFSVLWTGQVRARHSEIYSFYFVHDGGARLYIDNQLLIDSWITPGNREPRGSLPLNAERWYVVRIEYWSERFTPRFTPTSGPVGASVTITGIGFTGATAVAFNGTSANFTVDSDSQITATVPDDAGNGTIRVSTPSGTDTSARAFEVTKTPVISRHETAPRLSWSSRSQPKEIVPQECLYADSDDNINPGAHRTDGGPEAMVVGETAVGAYGPLAAEDFGAPLFDDTAHHFTVRVNAAAVRAPGKLETIRAVLDAEKPAHTDYHLCVVEPTFLVGVQARLGNDAYVAALPHAGRYDEGRLGLDARLGISSEHDEGTLRIDETLRIGPTAILR